MVHWVVERVNCNSLQCWMIGSGKNTNQISTSEAMENDEQFDEEGIARWAGSDVVGKEVCCNCSSLYFAYVGGSKTNTVLYLP